MAARSPATHGHISKLRAQPEPVNPVFHVRESPYLKVRIKRAAGAIDGSTTLPPFWIRASRCCKFSNISDGRLAVDHVQSSTGICRTINCFIPIEQPIFIVSGASDTVQLSKLQKRGICRQNATVSFAQRRRKLDRGLPAARRAAPSSAAVPAVRRAPRTSNSDQGPPRRCRGAGLPRAKPRAG